MSTRTTDLKDVLKQLDKLGWQHRPIRGGHLVTAPDGQVARIGGKGDSRGQRNTMADLNRIGFKDALERYEEETERKRQEAIETDRASVRPVMPQFKVAEAASTSANDSSAPALGGELSLIDALMMQPQFADALKANPALVEQVRAATNMRARVTVVTPDMAAEWISRPMVARTSDGKELRQRPLDNGWVEELEGRIRRGEWYLSPEGWVFAPDGSMLDGQHRSWAVFNTGIPVVGWVIENCPPDVFAILNSGKKRTAADALYITGESNTLNLASATKLLICYEGWRSTEDKAKAKNWTGWSRERISNTQITAALDVHPDLRDCNRAGHTISKRCGLTTGALAVFRYVARRAWPEGEETFEGFWTALDTGEMLPTGHPAKTLREWGLRDGGKKLKGVPRRELHFLMLMKCWNAWCLGRQVKAIRFTMGEPIPAPFHPAITR